MKAVTMYVSDDGMTFRTEEDCRAHEVRCYDTTAANDMLRNGATLYAALNRANMARPGWDDGLCSEDKDFLIRATRQTSFVVRHWQCSAMPIYRVCRIETDGRLFLDSDGDDTHAPYGESVSVEDLLRYARQTADSQA